LRKMAASWQQKEGWNYEFQRNSAGSVPLESDAHATALS